MLDKRHRDVLEKMVAPGEPSTDVRAAIRAALGALDAPTPMLLYCPMCRERHVDEGSQATTPHRTHACQNPRCGHLWAPAVVATVGVWTLPGCLNAPDDREQVVEKVSRTTDSSGGHEWRWSREPGGADVQDCPHCPVQRRLFGQRPVWQYRASSTAAWRVDTIPIGCARGWDAAGALTRRCPTCYSEFGQPCSSHTGSGLPMTVGEYDAELHQERCWR